MSQDAAHQDWHLRHRHRRLAFPIQDVEQHPGGALAGCEGVPVRICLPGNQGIGVLYHHLGDVRMQVERGDDRHARADDLTHRGEQISFEIADVLHRR